MIAMMRRIEDVAEFFFVFLFCFVLFFTGREYCII